MARSALEDDRRAVLRRIDRHALPEADSSSERDGTRPGLSLRIVFAILLVLGAVVLALWAPWKSQPAAVEVPPTAPAATPGADAQAPSAETSASHESGAETSASHEFDEGTADGQPPNPHNVAAGSVEGSATQSLTINIIGHVAEPGVHTVPAGARVIDAIEAAGGPTPKADLTRLNLARTLQDEAFLAVLAAGEDPPELLAPYTPQAAAGGKEQSSDAGTETGPGTGAVLNLNSATEAELQDLPGVGPVMAGRIIAWRQDHDGFRSVDELHEISGVGPKVFAQLEPLVTV